MNICKCFFCEEDILVIKTDTYIIANQKKLFCNKYGYVKYLVGKIGKKQICNECLEDIYNLTDSNIRKVAIDVDKDIIYG